MFGTDRIYSAEVFFVLGVDGREGGYGGDIYRCFACSSVCDFGGETLSYGGVIQFGFWKFAVGKNWIVIVLML